MSTENNVAAQAGDEPMREAFFAWFAEHGSGQGDYKAAQDAFCAGYQVSPRATVDVERDAARYQFLRHCDLDALASDNWGIKEVYTGKKLDDAIDAAIATTKPGA